MANDFTVRPIKVDTAMGSTWIATVAGTFPRSGFSIKKVIWEAPTTAAHTFNINDGSGKHLLSGVCDAANKTFTYDFDKPLRCRDFQVSQISSGILYIYG